MVSREAAWRSRVFLDLPFQGTKANEEISRLRFAARDDGKKDSSFVHKPGTGSVVRDDVYDRLKVKHMMILDLCKGLSAKENKTHLWIISNLLGNHFPVDQFLG